MSARSSTVKVFVRFRPTPNFAQEKIRLGDDHKTVEIHVKKDEKFGVVNNKRSDWSFKVDGVLSDASQETVYEVVAKSVVSKALDGYNGTIMCYGQTGAGKTFTTTGSMENYQHRGIIPRALQQVFKEIEERSDLSVTVRISYLEIYNETLSDLLATSPDVPAPDQLTIVDDPQGVSVKGLSVHLAGTEEHALNLLFEGETNRIIGSHILNKSSSRSHCIFTVHLESHSRTLSDAKYTISKINLVDLAGSERVGKTGSEGQVLKEAAYINKSLTFLEQAIMALSERGREHVPFRQSKLTHALRDSLGGSCSTILVANVYGEAAQIDETLSTLRFACRMKCIPVEPAAVERYNPLRVIKNLQKEIEHLKRELAVHDTLAGRTHITYEPFSEAQIAEMNSQVRRYLDGTLEEIDIRNLRQIQEIFSQFRLILSKQEQEVESRLRQKYPLIDKSDYPAGAQKAGLLDADGQLVGDLDGHSFSVGAAPHSSKPNSSLSTRKTKSRKSKESSPTSRREGTTSPSPSRDPEPATLCKPSLTSVSTKELEATVKEQETTAPDGRPPDQPTKEETGCPGTPPPKQAAFEDFKADRGSELHAIFKENKTILGDRRKKLKEITQRINVIKQEIDVTSRDLNVTKLEREKEGEYISSEGQVIIDEKEFMLIIRLKDLKKQYRADYDELQDLRAEVQYCQKLVDRCRQRLFTEFECWYNECFVIPEELQTSLKGSVRPGLLPLRKVMSLGEDEQEKYDELQKELLMEVPGALAFHAAKIKSDQKQNHSKAVARLPAAKRRPGLITTSMKNRPPSTLVAV